MESYQFLKWDTEFFGYKIALVEPNRLELLPLVQLIDELKKNSYKLIYCFVKPEDKISIKTLNLISAVLVDTKVTYSAHTAHLMYSTVDEHIVPYLYRYPNARLKSLVLQSGMYSRFKVDQNFSNHEYENLYLEWIKQSIKQKLADKILVYKEGKNILGFITLKVEAGIGSVGLIAVDQEERGKSIGKKLLTAGISFFRDNGVSEVRIVTQKANHAACRFYESNGFNVCKSVNIYHLWMK